jgi:hypothetical protein
MSVISGSNGRPPSRRRLPDEIGQLHSQPIGLRPPGRGVQLRALTEPLLQSGITPQEVAIAMLGLEPRPRQHFVSRPAWIGLCLRRSRVLQSTIKCRGCGTLKTETMLTDACQFFYDCKRAAPSATRRLLRVLLLRRRAVPAHPVGRQVGLLQLRLRCSATPKRAWDDRRRADGPPARPSPSRGSPR